MSANFPWPRAPAQERFPKLRGQLLGGDGSRRSTQCRIQARRWRWWAALFGLFPLGIEFQAQFRSSKQPAIGNQCTRRTASRCFGVPLRIEKEELSSRWRSWPKPWPFHRAREAVGHAQQEGEGWITSCMRNWSPARVRKPSWSSAPWRAGGPRSFPAKLLPERQSTGRPPASQNRPRRVWH